MSLTNDLAMGWRFARGLSDYMQHVKGPADPLAAVRRQLAVRQERFAETLRRGVFGKPASPYLRLMQQAQIDETTALRLVRQEGLESALQRFYDAGVYVTLDEFKGRTPLVRPGIELPVKAADFDNPLAKQHMQGRTGGSRTHGTRLVLDLDDFTEELAANALWMGVFGVLDLPEVMWRPSPPATAGIRNMLSNIKTGAHIERWYSQTDPGPRPPAGLRGAILSALTCSLTALYGEPIPWPRHVPMDRCEPIVRWLATETARGRRIYFDLMVSSAVRVCIVARELGLDISGHMIKTTAEPMTAAKARVIWDAGCDIMSSYGLTDCGRVAVQCATPNAIDDMHVYSHKMAFLPISRLMPGWPQPVSALYLTTLLPTAPKMMLNVESGDYAVVSERQCGCALGAAGLTTHLHSVRNYEKLTSAGMHFMGADLIELLEVALPGRYGGGPTDYQFVETEARGETVLQLVIHPRVGALDAVEVKGFVLQELERRTAGGRLMTDIWRDSDTLHVVRATPYTTGLAKIQPLHVMPSRIRPSQ